MTAASVNPTALLTCPMGGRTSRSPSAATVTVCPATMARL